MLLSLILVAVSFPLVEEYRESTPQSSVKVVFALLCPGIGLCRHHKGCTTKSTEDEKFFHCCKDFQVKYLAFWFIILEFIHAIK